MGTSQSVATPGTSFAATPASSAAQQIVAAAGLSDEGVALLAPDDKPRAYLDRLLAKELSSDVVRFLAYVLPKREAIWWSWVCARKAAGPTPPNAVKSMLDAIERWIVQPTDANRRAAYAATELGDIASSAGMACVAVFFSGGSIAPDGMPDVPASDKMTPKAVVGSITLAAVSNPDEMKQRWAEFAKMGLEVVERIKLFPGA